MTMWEADITYAWIRIIVATFYLQQSDAYKYNSWNYIKDEMGFFFLKDFSSFLSDPSPIIGNPCHSLTDWLTHSLT